jgi:hypothetical protein
VGYNAMKSAENQPMFQRNIALSSSVWKNKPSKKPASRAMFFLCAACFVLVTCFFIVRPWRWKRYVPPKCLLNSNEIHCVVSQKTQPFISMADQVLQEKSVSLYTLSTT